MLSAQKSHNVSSRLYRKTRKEKGEGNRPSRQHPSSTRSSSLAAGEDFPAQSALCFTRVRVIVLSLVLLGVTLSMLFSFFFLFTGGMLRFSLHALALPSLFPLIGGGGGVGILLWITIAFFLKRKRGTTSDQLSLLPAYALVSGFGAFPPGPSRRRTGELFSSNVDTESDRWIALEWGRDPARQSTDTLETTHVRQRLRTFQLSYLDDFVGDRNTDEFYQIKNVDGRNIIPRKTSTDSFFIENWERVIAK